MNLGKFSISLAVSNLQKSLEFYEMLGFEQIAGNADENWLILKNGVAHVGIFQGMFEENLMTFNPTDARSIETAIEKAGYEITKKTEGTEGPAHFVLTDPDGNTILVDQHE